MRDRYIKIILDLQNTLKYIADKNYDWYSISEYDSVYSDICEYVDDDFNCFKTNKELIDYIDYLIHLINGGIKEEQQ